MFFDQSWLGYGLVGAAEMSAIAIAIVVGFLVFLPIYWLARKQAWGWSQGKQIAVSFLLAVLLAGGYDLWNLFYICVALLQGSLQLLRLELAQMHDPDSIGLRVVFELAGTAVGIYLSWRIFSRELNV